MKKSLLGLLVVPFAITACEGGNNDFYGKTFTYRNACIYNLEYSITSTGNDSYRSIIEKQMSVNNIDWNESGGLSGSGLFSEVIPFEKHANYSEVVQSMEKLAVDTFNKVYDKFSFTVGTKEDKKFTFNIGEITKECSFKLYQDQDTVMMIYEGEKKIGQLSVAAIPGYGARNGKFDTVELELDGVISRVGFTVTFINEVKIGDKSYTGMDWHVWAKINN